MTAIDSSAVFSVLFNEDDKDDFSSALVRATDPVMSAPILLECHFVVGGRFGEGGRIVLDKFLASLNVAFVPLDRNMAAFAIESRYRFGKGTGHPAQLNFGDCFSYALAKTRNLPLLFKGDDFVHTDIVPALETR